MLLNFINRFRLFVNNNCLLIIQQGTKETMECNSVAQAARKYTLISTLMKENYKSRLLCVCLNISRYPGQNILLWRHCLCDIMGFSLIHWVIEFTDFAMLFLTGFQLAYLQFSLSLVMLFFIVINERSYVIKVSKPPYREKQRYNPHSSVEAFSETVKNIFVVLPRNCFSFLLYQFNITVMIMCSVILHGKHTFHSILTQFSIQCLLV